jgi:hypothetical protein
MGYGQMNAGLSWSDKPFAFKEFFLFSWTVTNAFSRKKDFQESNII